MKLRIEADHGRVRYVFDGGIRGPDGKLYDVELEIDPDEADAIGNLSHEMAATARVQRAIMKAGGR